MDLLSSGVISISILLVVISNVIGSKIGEIAAAVPDPRRNLMVSEPVKYVTHNGIEVSLNSLKKQVDEDNKKELLHSGSPNRRITGIRRMKKRNRLTCHSCKPPNCTDPGTCGGAVSCFTSIFRDTEGVVHRSKGCVVKFDHQLLYCSTRRHDGRKVHEQYGRSAQYAHECCKEFSLCNNATEWPILPDVPDIDYDSDYYEDFEDSNRIAASNSSSSAQHMELAMAIVVPIICVALIAVGIVCLMKYCHNLKMKDFKVTLNPFKPLNPFSGTPWENNINGPGETELLAGTRVRPVGDSTLRDFRGGVEESLTSGSGSGMPHLVQRTLAKQITLQERIGKGRYGEVWRGEWNGDNVAVKIFLTKDEDSWKRETDIYSTILLRHENILGYVGSDCTSLNSCTQLWLVTHHYKHGSLYDFLKDPDRPLLTTCQAYGILMSSLSGLVHLHTEIFGTRNQSQQNYKPAIAHRDVKSKNILVREDGFSCVIADFGLAVTHDSTIGQTDERQNYRVGTKRYMSPEVLDGSIENNKRFESYKSVDIYALSLVMWEVIRCTRFASQEKSANVNSRCSADFTDGNDYALPYHLDVGPDPSFEEMKKVVCTEKRRPNLLPEWISGGNSFFAGLCGIMKECWHENPSVRQSMLRIKKNLLDLQEQAVNLDQHVESVDNALCYFSLRGLHKRTNNGQGSFNGHALPNGILAVGTQPAGGQLDLMSRPGAVVGRGLGFSRHSITGGGGRGIGEGCATAGSGSLNSTATQTSYCSSGYQSKLGSQSGGVDQSGVVSGDNFVTSFNHEFQHRPSNCSPSLNNLSPSEVFGNESHQMPVLSHSRLRQSQVLNGANNHGTTGNIGHTPRGRSLVPRTRIQSGPLVDPMLDEQEEEGTQS